MCNYYDSVASIVDKIESIDKYLINAEKYYAHTPGEKLATTHPELLSEHVHLVLSYFKKIVEVHKLDEVIDNLIDEYLLEQKIESEISGNFIKSLFVNVIVFHDFGKINENFQASPYKMDNPFFRGKEIAESPIGSNHSSLGAFIFISKHLNDVEKIFPKTQRGFGVITTLIFSYSIFKHHSKWLNDDFWDEINFKKEALFLERYLSNYKIQSNPNITKLLSDTKNLFSHSAFNRYIRSFSLYSLLRLNFSLLTASDYLATNEYRNGFAIDDLGVLTSKRIDEIFEYVSQNEWLDRELGKKNYNKATYENLDKAIGKVPVEESGTNLNVLRQHMAKNVINNIRSNYQSNLFYIEAPTGGGKTNLSLLATIELLKAYHGNLNKVFYVFPFTTLITQTYKSIKETFGLNETEVVEIHSKAGIKTKNIEDDNYGKDRIDYIDNLFVTFPFCLLTHIKFFDLLKTNEKEPNYLLHRLANSIVVIDELQSYNPEHWDKVIYFVKKYASLYNIKFILMSATLPKLDKLNVIKNQVNDFVYLLPNSKQDYFRNPNFCNRVSFRFDLIENNNITLQEIADLLLSESFDYSKKNFGKAKPEESVYTIIEFIFKKTASEFYSIIKQNNTFFDEVFLLSGTILEHRRREIINSLKNPTNRKKKILLITTQVVEAGVDIDMDLGFKDTSLVDSDEQLAGRINRNVNKKDCKLFLFNYNKESLIYKDKRLEITKKLPKNDYHNILRTKDFDKLYDLVINDANEWNLTEMAYGFNEYEQKIKTLKFHSIHKDFQLIDQKNISCFVPVDLPIAVVGATDNSTEKIFSDRDLSFLAKNNIYPNKKNEISGEAIFDLYIQTITNKIDYSKQKLKEKTLQGIMSKFVFSLFASPKVESQIILFSDEEKSEYGYKYLNRWNEFYDINFGMNDKMFNSNETQFL